MRLGEDFFMRHTLTVAAELPGKELVFGDIRGIITETEAYCGQDDPASHAFRGAQGRAAVMYGAPGVSYVYLIYGMYHCLNIVTEEKGSPGGVLIRGLYLPGSSQAPESGLHLNGPGKLCRHLGITKAHSGLSLLNGGSFYVRESGVTVHDRLVTPRIGITKAADRPWRFVLTEFTLPGGGVCKTGYTRGGRQAG